MATLQETAASAGYRPTLLAYLSDAESAQACGQCLDELKLPGSEVRRGNVETAITYLAANRSPQTLIVDISGAELPLSAINRLADVCEPNVQLIAVGDRNDVALYRDLTHLGVSDYLVKPVPPAVLRKALTATARPQGDRSPRKQGKLIAITGARGGVGTSTLAANISWILANRSKRRVALLDLDLYNGDCALLLGAEPTTGLREALETPERVDSLFVERTMTRCGDNLFVMNSETRLDAPLNFAPEAADPLLEVLRTQFHYVIVDLPRTLQKIHHRVIQSANVRVVVADLTLRALRDTVRLMGHFGPDSEAARSLVVINRRGEYAGAEIPLEEFSKAVQHTPRYVITFDPKAMINAANMGKPVAGSRGRLSDTLVALSADIGGQAPERSRWSLRLFK
jgi:pilus assembly protein CpaE